MAAYGQSIGQAIGTAWAGPIGGQIGKALGNIADRIFGADQGPTAAGVNSSFDAQGNLIGRVKSGATSNAEVDQFTSLLGASYQQILAKFGATGKASTFGFQKTSDGFFDVSANVGGSGVFQQGRTAYSEASLQLASSRAIFAALQASELPGYLSKAFDGIVANTASADQINGALAFADSLKQIRFGLLSASEQAAEYQKIIDASTVSLGTSAATFKTDFIAAIDEGLTPETLAQWNALGETMQALEQITGKAASGVDEVVRSLKDIANERTRLQDELDSLTLSSSDLLAKQRNALDESNRALFDQVEAAKAAKAANEAYAQSISDNTDNALAGVRRAVDAQSSIVRAQLSVAQESVSNLTSIFNTLKGGIQSLYGSADSVGAFNTASATSFLDNALANVKASGYLPDATDLADAVNQAISGTNSAIYATQADAEFERLKLAGTLSGLKDAAGVQLTAAEQAVKIAEQQLETLDAQLRAAEQQVDALRGIDTSVLSVQAAIEALSRAVGVERAGAAGGAAGGSSAGGSTPSNLYGNMTSPQASLAFALGEIDQSGNGGAFSVADTLAWASRAADATGKSAEQAIYDIAKAQGLPANLVAQNTGYTVAEIDEWTRRQGLPKLATGTNLVPRDMIAMLHEGEAVVPKAYNPAAGGSNNTDKLVEALIAEVKELRATVAIGNANTRRTADAVNGSPDQPLLVSTVPL
jgi:hypothetical protein